MKCFEGCREPLYARFINAFKSLLHVLRGFWCLKMNNFLGKTKFEHMEDKKMLSALFNFLQMNLATLMCTGWKWKMKSKNPRSWSWLWEWPWILNLSSSREMHLPSKSETEDFQKHADTSVQRDQRSHHEGEVWASWHVFAWKSRGHIRELE